MCNLQIIQIRGQRNDVGLHLRVRTFLV